MKRPAPIVFIVLGLAFGTAAAVLAYRAASRGTARVVVTRKVLPPKTVAVVVAARDLEIGTTLSASDLRVVPWPADAVPGHAAGNPAELIGRVTRARLVANEPVLTDELGPPGAHGPLSLVIPKGMRAISVRVNEVSGISGFIAPGSRVDVIIAGTPRVMPGLPAASGALRERHARTLLQDIEVLALNKELESADGGPPDRVNTATLLVTPAQAELLTLAADEGTLQLVLRGARDHTPAGTTGAAASDLFAPVHMASLSRANSFPVEIIRGSQRTIEEF